jgi:hypothetical protein
MDFRCPNCQKELTVPDEYAGQLMKCPLCQNTFQAPALPPPVSAAAPPQAPTDVYGIKAETPAAPPPARAPEAPAVPPRRPEAPAPEPPAPVGDYARSLTLRLNPQVIPWVVPAALVLLFVLTCFPWVDVLVREQAQTLTRNAWGLAFTEWNALTLMYLLLFLVSFLLSVALTAVRFAPGARIPPALQQLWPWRSALVGFLLFLGLFFLALQLLAGFKTTSQEMGAGTGLVVTTVFVWLSLLCHLVAMVAAWCDFWVEVRGPSRPLPRIDVHW